MTLISHGATWLRVAVLAFLVSFSTLSAAASDPQPPLEVEPGTLTIDRYDQAATAQVTVVARNAASEHISLGSALSSIQPPGFRVTLSKPQMIGADIVWQGTVSVTDTVLDAGSIEFVINHGTAAPLRAELEVKLNPLQVASPADDLDLSVKASLTAMSNFAPGRAVVLIKNKSAQALTVQNLTFTGAAPVSVTPDPHSWTLKLEPHETWVHAFAFQFLDSRIPDGSYSIIMTAKAERGTGVQRSTGTAMVEIPATTAVPGIPDALKLLQIPSVLLIPGAIILAWWALFLGAAPTWMDWKSSTFWVASITISIFVFAAFAVVRYRYQWGPNFLVGYNLLDIAYLWIGCVAVAFLSFGARKSYRFLQAWRKEHKRRLWEPLPSDQPIDFLRKLQRNKMGFYFHSFPVAPGSDVSRFITNFPAPAGAPGMAWFIPQMDLSSIQHVAARDLLIGLNAANDVSTGLDDLIAKLDIGLGKKLIELKWHPSDSGPALRPALKPAEDSPETSPIVFVAS